MLEPMGTLLQPEVQCPSTLLITRQYLRSEILPSTSTNSVYPSALPGLRIMSKQEKLTTPIPYLMRNYCFHERVRVSLSLPQHAGTPIRPAFVLVPGTHEEVHEFKNLDLFFYIHCRRGRRDVCIALREWRRRPVLFAIIHLHSALSPRVPELRDL
ncbi:hypothetical protein P167DRAFT_238445 [Morchella conica CCBAS932]|uniref:Uncharacterized protein n=1 Tax=Morchella conica CCBAS932 TaxID=1392247 RepID=A0A3N4KK61_9PEZI|nr:hypothetical protein P167DRAFT_238445 [Morchella conica CCBAS932]